MPALSTSLKVTNSNNEKIYTAQLFWWNPYTLLNHELFTAVHDNGYIDRVAQLNLQQFVDLNREQIQQYSRDLLYQHKEQIENITAHIRSGDWDNATLQVTLYEWESGLS
jgi:hypothetical protein